MPMHAASNILRPCSHRRCIFIKSTWCR